jgi:hypothetical protein
MGSERSGAVSAASDGVGGGRRGEAADKFGPCCRLEKAARMPRSAPQARPPERSGAVSAASDGVGGSRRGEAPRTEWCAQHDSNVRPPGS